MKLIVDLARRCEYADSDSDDRYNMLNSLDIDVIWQWILRRYYLMVRLNFHDTYVLMCGNVTSDGYLSKASTMVED